MQRLRATFTRSRTPTGSEMKTQSSLDVTKQVRSASFDEIKLEAQRFVATQLSQQHDRQIPASASTTTTTTKTTAAAAIPAVPHFSFKESETSNNDSFLKVPQIQSPYSKRSHSFDAPIALMGSDDSGTFLEVPKTTSKSRRNSSTKTPPCIHCFYLEELEIQENVIQYDQSELVDFSNTSHSLSNDDYDFDSMSECSNDDEIPQLLHDDNTVASPVPLIEVQDDDDEHYNNESIKITESAVLQQKHKETINSSIVISADDTLEGSSESLPSVTFNSITLPQLSSAPCNITLNVTPINGDYLPYDNTCLIQTTSSPTPPTPSSSTGPCPTPTFSLELLNSKSITPDSLNNNNQFNTSETIICNDMSNDAAQSNLADFEERPRRRSISRQEAIFIEPSTNSLENISQQDKQRDSINDDTSTTPTNDLNIYMKHVSIVGDIYLTVPDVKRDRAVSVDSCFSKLSSNKPEELKSHGIVGDTGSCDLLTVPNTINTIRSRSVDIVLPTNEQAYYKAVAMTSIYSSYRRSSTTINSRRPIRIVPDWTENAVQGEHFWKPTSASGDLCCLNEECIKSGQRMKCSACQIIAHQNCIPIVNEKTVLACKPTFRDVGIRQYREQSVTHHHWVHRKIEKGKCKQCGKAIQSKLFGSKEIVALSCAWCHEVYHNKETCFNQTKIGETCKLGNYAPIIVPPSWIVKLPSKGNFKSSIRVNNKNNAGNGITKKLRGSTKRNKQRDERKEHRAFIVKPIPSTDVIPVIVFINPKSGGNQGVKLLGKFQYLLNPRQVFDLTQGGPKMGLEMFRKAPNLRVLACGGDGTVGWVLSTLDQLNPPIQPAPAVGVLPLGTGNDLARALGWGGGYTDEPIGKILREIGMSQTVLMDRWHLKVTPNNNATDDRGSRGKDNVPLNVMNNYFSFGVDAHIALEFHEAREAHPEKFNSRLRNKMYYGQMGGKDLILRQYRNLSQWITLECDGNDYTSKLKDAGCHAVLFLNIPSYGGGTHPWNESFGQTKSSIDDGLMEVVGLTTYQLPMLQAGMHGTCICQCKTARITTNRTIPMQVDGEACRVKPSIIEVELLNKAVMLAKRKHGRGDFQVNPLEKLQLSIIRVTMDQYERFHYDKEMLRKLANKLGVIEIESQCDLEQVRNMLNTKFEESALYPRVSQDWCFIDCCTAEYYFRIDRAQEHLHYICDIAVDELYILDHEAATMPQTPDQERSFAAYSQRHLQNDQDNSGNTVLYWSKLPMPYF